jgi:hypothetical protein
MRRWVIAVRVFYSALTLNLVPRLIMDGAVPLLGYAVVHLADALRCKLEGRPDPARKLYDIYHCCVYSEKLLMMDRGTVRNV